MPDMDPASPHDLGTVLSGIGSLTKAQADAVRDRIRRDAWWYRRLKQRMFGWFFRDAVTQKAIEQVSNVEHRLQCLEWTMHAAGAGGPDGQQVADDWRGWGI